MHGRRAVTSDGAIEFAASDGYRLSGRWFAAARGRGALLVSSATGFPQTYYYKFAQYAAERGYDSLVYDYRGIGQSARQPLAAEPARMSDWARYDMPAALELVAQRSTAPHRFTLGHSIGGQFIGMLRNHSLAAAHIHVAASTGFWRWETAPFRYLAWYFWRVHGPVSLALKGYVPSGAGWSGLPLPRGVFSEWRDWCLRREHFAPDVVAGRVPNYFDSLTAPLLSIGFTDDPIATRRTVAALLAFYANAQLEQRWYGPQDIGSRRIGHEGFFASRHRDALWTPTLDWLDAQLTRLTNRTT